MKIDQPEGDDLQGFEAPTEEQAKALREGFAAHVSANAEFQQAVKGLMKTQNPRASEQLLERQYVPKVELDSQATELGHPTLRVERPFGALPVDGSDEDAREPGAPSQSDAEALVEGQAEPASGRSRQVALAALITLSVGLAVIVFLWATGPSEVADGPGPREQPTGVGPSVATTGTASAPSVATTPSQTAAPTSNPSSSPSATAKPQGTGVASSRVHSVRSTSSSDTKDPDGWRFNP